MGVRGHTKAYTGYAGYGPPLSFSKGWNGYACRWRGGPRLLRRPSEAGRGYLRDRPGRAHAGFRSGIGRRGPTDGRPRLPGGTAPRALHSDTRRGRAIQGGNPAVPTGSTPPIHALRRGNLVDRVELSGGDRRGRNGGRGDQRTSRPPADRDEPNPGRRVPRHRGRHVSKGAEDPEAREEAPDRRLGIHRRIPRPQGIAA